MAFWGTERCHAIEVHAGAVAGLELLGRIAEKDSGGLTARAEIPVGISFDARLFIGPIPFLDIGIGTGFRAPIIEDEQGFVTIPLYGILRIPIDLGPIVLLNSVGAGYSFLIIGTEDEPADEGDRGGFHFRVDTGIRFLDHFVFRVGFTQERPALWGSDRSVYNSLSINFGGEF